MKRAVGFIFTVIVQKVKVQVWQWLAQCSEMKNSNKAGGQPVTDWKERQSWLTIVY
ncbi:hypothetical protein BMETH_1342_0 [methanotrophic bacterial endosymbiont of Bathymodiolus sp.]|nr:hypothetical protein BMETH_1342_0 [methanotrophic bacterial endosymbiont of Bathymodiolus sp.]